MIHHSIRVLESMAKTGCGLECTEGTGPGIRVSTLVVSVHLLTIRSAGGVHPGFPRRLSAYCRDMTGSSGSRKASRGSLEMALANYILPAREAWPGWKITGHYDPLNTLYVV